MTGPVPGGPADGSVIPSFLGHVASRMWSGEMRGNLKCQSRGGYHTKLRAWYEKMSDEAKKVIDESGLGHLPSTMFSHLDTPLLCAFVERWQPDTNTFHLPFGEMTIMLHDVWHILRIPIEGITVSGTPNTGEVQSMCMHLLGVTRADLLARFWSGGGIYSDEIIRICAEDDMLETTTMGWIWLMLGSTMFVDKSGNRVRPSCLTEVLDGVETMQQYSWGSATLAYLYRHLGISSRGDSQGLTGCLTLLQAWIYEYFPCF